MQAIIIGYMGKFISAISGAVLLLGLACSGTDQPGATGQQQQLTSAVLDQVSQQSTPVALDRDDQASDSSPKGRARDMEGAGRDAETDGPPEVSAFHRELGRTYPGLLTLPECSTSTQLTMAPLAEDAYEVIIPLGLLTTPQHVLPTSHVYYHLVRDATESNRYGPPAVAEVRAPGNVRILGMNSSESMGGPRGDYIDFDITFAPCRGRMYQFLHVSTLNPELEELFHAGLTGRCEEYGDAQSKYRLCKSSVELDVPVGTVLGTAGGKVSSALDLEAYDLEGAALKYANPARFGSEFDLRLKVTCPFDDFTAELRESQLARMGDYDLQPRTAEPRCGEVMQDILGTAQGNWYTGETGAHANWSQELALVHDNVDPALAAISIGGVVSDSGVWLFPPKSSGFVNRDFAEVTADGRVYCYQGATTDEGGRSPDPFPGRLLISLTNDAEMLVERQDGGCAECLAFIDPVIYKR